MHQHPPLLVMWLLHPIVALLCMGATHQLGDRTDHKSCRVGTKASRHAGIKHASAGSSGVANIEVLFLPPPAFPPQSLPSQLRGVAGAGDLHGGGGIAHVVVHLLQAECCDAPQLQGRQT